MNEKIDDCVIYCQNVSKEFYIVNEQFYWRIIFYGNKCKLNSFKALSDVSLRVPKGKFVGILGRNGAGKSTLLRVLAGVYSPTSGVINTSGMISSLFEMGGFGNNRLSGFAYANRFLEIYGVENKKARKALIKNIEEFSELGSYFYKPIYSYSSGMKARLFFATATEMQHEIYLVDELLSVGDEHFQAKCWKRLRERFTNGASGILVTHDWAAILKICEFSYILEQGKIVHSGNSDVIVQKYLNLPVPTKQFAEIIPNSIGYIFESGKDSALKFDLLLKKETPIAISYSIEWFRGGYGWEVIMMSEEFTPIDCHIGINRIAIKIKSLPLVAGTYYFNIFLKSLSPEVNDLSLDIRSWTYGNGIKMEVIGGNTNEMVALNWNEQLKVINDANS